MESLLDFEFTLAIIEAISDIILSAYRVPAAVLETTFWELESVMPRLEVCKTTGIVVRGTRLTPLTIMCFTDKSWLRKRPLKRATRCQNFMLAHSPCSR